MTVDDSTLVKELNLCNKKLKMFPFSPRLYIQRGMIHFKLALLKESLRDFNKAEELNPQITPYLWQRGLTYYYLGKYAKAYRQFELVHTVSRQNIEDSLWIYLSMAKLEGAEEARKYLPAIKRDSRAFMRQIYQVYAGMTDVKTLLNHTNDEDKKNLFFRYLYAGLYQFVHQDEVGANNHISRALDCKIENYMWYLARVHLHLHQRPNETK
ncbi:MAG: hypothetical protein NZ901_11640 [Geminocystis sp.]|nr:hypothetical protein [Geminocystis sp.]HIK37410.1 hypothetical protein [Geminocystis sp. M7585_C2015_104]MCS7148823.1 hypothetical protein [Geminocystis sp.]MCX8077380.1 hypothetical protein [Geminocystis sp.]MDW8115907.1 hypothetical protein [Geminocystis sp.]